MLSANCYVYNITPTPDAQEVQQRSGGEITRARGQGHLLRDCVLQQEARLMKAQEYGCLNKT